LPLPCVAALSLHPNLLNWIAEMLGPACLSPLHHTEGTIFGIEKGTGSWTVKEFEKDRFLNS
jgi:hypothetical protein